MCHQQILVDFPVVRIQDQQRAIPADCVAFARFVAGRGQAWHPIQWHQDNAAILKMDVHVRLIKRQVVGARLGWDNVSAASIGNGMGLSLIHI